MNRDKKYIGGIVALFLAAFAWGSAYTVMKSNLEIFPAMWLLGIRFAIAGALTTVWALSGHRFWKWFQRVAVFLLVALVPFGYLLSTGAVEWGPVREVAERVGPPARSS